MVRRYPKPSSRSESTSWSLAPYRHHEPQLRGVRGVFCSESVKKMLRGHPLSQRFSETCFNGVAVCCKQIESAFSCPVELETANPQDTIATAAWARTLD